MTEHVLQYLASAEDAETDPDYRDSYRISWITTSLAYQDHPLAFLEAFYRVYGVSPEKLPEKLRQRRLAQLERWYEAFWGELPPKKASQSVLPTNRMQYRVTVKT